jgi:GT2 family glycosyltransferase
MNPPSPSVAAKVSVVVPHYRDLPGLERCLTALERQTYPHDRIEIIVADNASPEGEAAIAGVIGGRARLVIVSEKGAGPARNGGVAVATGEILAFTDSDCQPEPDWLLQGVRALARCDFAGGRMKVLVDDAARMTPSEAFERVFAFDNETYVTRKGFTVTANLFAPRMLFDAVGGFRNGVSEDVDWSHRAVKHGHRIGYAPDAVVGHPARRRWPELQSKWRRMNAETYSLFVAKKGGRLRWLARASLLPLSAVVHSPRALFSKELSSFDQRLSALGMLHRLRWWRFADSVRLAARSRELR